uniref:LIM domain only 4a n=1 Tax=Salarias fasciatus TaxID=181472 RepID=A0A672J368_SALFA
MVNNQPAGSAPRPCAGCGGKISDRFLLFSMERYWHTRCLKCSCCQAQLGDIGTSCYSKGGMILCRSDYIRLFGHSGACSACGQSIPANEMVMRAQGNVYHLKVSPAPAAAPTPAEALCGEAVTSASSLRSASAAPPVGTDSCPATASTTSTEPSSASTTGPALPCSAATCRRCRAAPC